MSIPRIVHVTAFIDWNAQIHNANPSGLEPTTVAERTLDHVGRVISRTLGPLDQSARFEVSLRLYHGWHKGFEPTANWRALTTIAAGADFSLLSTKSNVSIRPEITFGNRLLQALDQRLHPRLGIHLPNTLRQDPRLIRGEGERMVDTAMATDIVALAYREPNRWIVVLGEDDDLVPALFAAEAIRIGHEGRVLLVRTRAAGPFLRLDGIIL
jgi:hypothetical protein